MDAQRLDGRAFGRRTWWLALLALVLAVASFAVPQAPARADSAPTDPANPATPATVAADGLPTVQINGVVWQQTVVGNTVYAAGKFTSARPAGAAAGTNETARNNLLAYDITTGNLITSFAPNLNAQARTVAASPDGKRLYVGGDFTTANGQTRNRIAAYDTATGALITTFHPSMSSTVLAIAATDTTVYVGGAFNSVGGISRTKLAAFSATDGSLLPWAPVPGVGPTDGNNDPSKVATGGNAATDDSVLALVVTGNGAQVVAGGRFYTMNGDVNTGVAALDPLTGASRPFAINQLVTNQGVNSAVYSLSTDGTTVYGSGYDFYGPGNLEGTFEVTADGGQVIAINDCHGDTYSTFATGGVLYLSSHEHDCGNIGGFPEENPRINKFATAVTTAATGTVGPETEANGNFIGQPAPSELPWFPTLTAGTYTGQAQAGWSVAGTSKYVVFGGEFAKVNGTAQQGLVRFAVPSIAPNKVGPAYDPTAMTPSVVQLASGVRVAWQATSDQDNENLTYKVIRSDKPSTPVFQTTAPSQFWSRPTLGFIDTTAKAGTTYSYRVYAYDPFNNATNGSATSITVSASGPSQDLYGSTVLADKPSDFWRFDEAAAATTSYDQAGFSDLTLGTGVAEGKTGALTGSSDTSAAFDGSDAGLAATRSAIQGPQTFSLEAWFNTTTTDGGKIVGFGNSNSGDSSNYDRHVFMDGSGTVYFGVYPGFSATVQSNRPYNDGQWHHVVATLGSGGMSLYLDDQLVGQRSDVTSAQDYSGYWRVGGDSTWAGAKYFAGTVDDVAVYPTVLTAGQVDRHYSVGTTGQPYNQPPTASFTSSASGLNASFDASGSTDAEGPVASYAWTFGDGTTGAGATTTHGFAGPGSYRVALTVTDSGGKTATASHVVSVTTSGTAGGAYSEAVQADGASYYWRLGEPSGPALDYVGTNDMTVGSGVTRATAGALVGDSDGAATFDGTENGLAVGQTLIPGPNTFSIEAWFNTTSTNGGKIVGFGNQPSGYSSNYDRHVYMDGSGTVYFGVWTGQATTVQSAPGLNDGKWHQVVASLSSAGLAMYIDGTLVGRNTSTTVGQSYAGFWRIGGDNSWAGAPFFAGSVDDVAIYPAALTDAQAARHYQLGTNTQPVNKAPTAAFTSSVSGLGVTVDGSGSSDPDGQVASYAWDFGDGVTGTGAQAQHAYAAGGTYPVTLTVTDDQGATGTVSHDVTVTAPPANQPPTSSFTAQADGLTLSVDGTGSKDPDGTVSSWTWDFGDGTTGTGQTAAHTYSAAGDYTVKLTVADNAGATGSSAQTFTLTAPPGPKVLASDAFNRTVSGGLGTADVGGAWTAQYGSTRQSVAPGAATLHLAAGGNQDTSYLGAVSQTSANVLTSLSLSSAPTGNGVSVTVTGRRVANNLEYRGRVRFLPTGQVGVALTMLNGTAAETVLGNKEVIVPGLNYTPGMALQVRVIVSGTGTTTLSATVWRAGDPEPATPTITGTDTTAALQSAGGLGITAYLAGNATAADDVKFTSYQVTAAN